MLSTTEIYTHVVIHKLKEIHTATHPARVDHKRADAELEATEEALFSALDEENMEDDEV